MSRSDQPRRRWSTRFQEATLGRFTGEPSCAGTLFDQAAVLETSPRTWASQRRLYFPAHYQVRKWYDASASTTSIAQRPSTCSKVGGMAKT